ncbi:MAG: hypothetical protein IK150_04065 [Lachnospiraceae bacterium]|nr:hypothetical protein [Lachnospiraceae bacterium]
MEDKKERKNKLRVLLPLLLLAGAALSYGIWRLAGHLCEQGGLILRNWVSYTLLSATFLCLVTGVILLILLIRIKVLKVILILLMSLLIAISPYYLFIAVVFSYKPEHVVDRDGEKYVAVVFAWLDTDVDYHEYENIFSYKKNIRITEWYGNGASDPLKNGYDKRPEPRSTTWFEYDDEGNRVY